MDGVLAWTCRPIVGGCMSFSASLLRKCVTYVLGIWCDASSQMGSLVRDCKHNHQWRLAWGRGVNQRRCSSGSNRCLASAAPKTDIREFCLLFVRWPPFVCPRLRTSKNEILPQLLLWIMAYNEKAAHAFTGETT